MLTCDTLVLRVMATIMSPPLHNWLSKCTYGTTNPNPLANLQKVFYSIEIPAKEPTKEDLTVRNATCKVHSKNYAFSFLGKFTTTIAGVYRVHTTIRNHSSIGCFEIKKFTAATTTEVNSLRHERVIMLFPRYRATFPASILEPLLNMHTASYMSVIPVIHEINAPRKV